jgi:hypothetical protein
MKMIAMIGMIIYAVFLGLALAFLEVQIEGKYGWAEKLPCWRKENGLIVEKILGGRSLTSYHIALFIFASLMIHLPFFLISWNFRAELVILGLLLELFLFDDFFWFLINPNFGLKKFTKSEVRWHKKWIGPVPEFYIYFTITAAIFFYFGYAGIS